MFGLGPTELIIILVIVLVIFGGEKLPDLARSLGEGVREFNKEKQKIQDQYEDATQSIEVDSNTDPPKDEKSSPEESSQSGQSDARTS